MRQLYNWQPRTLVAALIAFVSRLSILPANLNVVGSFGFFGGNVWLFMASIIIFDAFVGGYYRGWMFTYLGFLAYPTLGTAARWLDSRLVHASWAPSWMHRWSLQVLFLPLASFAFFIFSNAGVWWHWYPHTIQGLLTCYTLALPFYQRTLIGDLGFGYGWLVIKLVLKQLASSPSIIRVQAVAKS